MLGLFRFMLLFYFFYWIAMGLVWCGVMIYNIGKPPLEPTPNEDTMGDKIMFAGAVGCAAYLLLSVIYFLAVDPVFATPMMLWEWGTSG
jgi:hypothetical protein